MSRIIKGVEHAVVRRLTFRGLKISVETDKGQTRQWRGGETKMWFPYGYFEGTKHNGVSGDGMALDVFVGRHEDAPDVYVIRQMHSPDFEEFDELKVMLGFESEKRARAAYLMHYEPQDERRIGDMEAYPFDEFVERFIKVDEDDPSVEKAMGFMPQVPQQPGMPAVGGVAMGMPMMPMMQQGPPPIDVDTYDGVEAILGRVGNMKDQELLRVVEKIWGPGYQYVNATPDHVRAEVRNYLLDQRDLLSSLQALAVSPPTPAFGASSPASSAAVPYATPPSPGSFPTSGGSPRSAS